LGCIKSGDYIIVTAVLSINPHKEVVESGILYSKQKVEFVDSMGLPAYYPYKVIFKDRAYWVCGVPYSPVMEELF
jgi:hypothetical protein